MEKVIVMIASTLGGSVGWWVGSGVGFMTAFLVSIVGTGIGIYYGRRLARNILP